MLGVSQPILVLKLGRKRENSGDDEKLHEEVGVDSNSFSFHNVNYRSSQSKSRGQANLFTAAVAPHVTSSEPGRQRAETRKPSTDKLVSMKLFPVSQFVVVPVPNAGVLKQSWPPPLLLPTNKQMVTSQQCRVSSQ